ILNFIFNVTDSTMLKGISEANSGSCRLNMLHYFYYCSLITPDSDTRPFKWRFLKITAIYVK
uniref:Uncharacterized protein n=1 Tax=Catagonus wagneri TaxID=51154 RepID=A0A8C3WWJ2_9CETA